MKQKSFTLLTALSLYILLAITFFLYLPGTNGFFIFDDIPNLSPMGKYTDLGLWENFWLFILEGDSGPLGRPISLASFYLNDIAWPSSPKSFIFTNIFIHLLNGILVFWFAYLLSKYFRLNDKTRYGFSLLATALWILHPLHNSTVLYIIQRMTELSTLFILLGLITYLYGRQKLLSGSLIQRTWVTSLIGLSLTLAILSKENGALLLVYIFVLEVFLIRPIEKKEISYWFNLWFSLIIILPIGAIITYLIYRGYIGNGYELRDFSVIERLLTEARVLLDYIYEILIPNSVGNGLFHDDFIISRSLISPWSTMLAVFIIFILFASSILLRHRSPILAFSLSWFFAGHLLESTSLPLELYFEHRNYLPLLGFSFLLSYAIFFSPIKTQKISYAGGIILILLMSLLTFQNANLWGNPKKLIAVWASYHPSSLRAIDAYNRYITPSRFGTPLPHGWKTSFHLKLNNIDKACNNGTLQEQALWALVKSADKHPISPTSTDALNSFASNWLAGRCKQINSDSIISFTNKLIANPNVQNNKKFVSSAHVFLARIYAKEQDFNSTMINIEAAYNLTPSLDLHILQTGYLASAGLHDLALQQLLDTKEVTTTLKNKLIFHFRKKQFLLIKKELEKKTLETNRNSNQS